MSRLLEATIRLFKGVPIKEKKRKQSKYWQEKAVGFGFIFSPYVIANYNDDCEKIIRLARKYIGISSEEINSSFHKSWRKIKESEIEDLVVEQLAHYVTTYGKENPKEYIMEKSVEWGIENLGAKIIGLRDFESDRIQDADYVYIPKEALEIPEFEGVNLVIIKGFTERELREKLLVLLEKGVALSEDTIEDVVEIAKFLELSRGEVENIKNKEVKIALYDYLNLIPENPVEFLRYIVYKLTNRTLLIKSKEVIEQLRNRSKTQIVKLFKKYDKEIGYNRLAEIFYRFKPLFLALRVDSKRMKKIVNKIRRLAKIYHKPLPEDYLNTVTAKIKHGELDVDKLKKELKKENIFRKIRLAYALKFRTKDVDSILYKIRNGKAFASDFSFDKKTKAKKVLNIVLDSIVEDIRKNVEGKKVYIPDYIHYSLPATEKQFTGDFPLGTYVSVSKDMIVGVYWKNVNGKRIDLDLSFISEEEKIGWDGYYRKEDTSILFSGDMTDAKNGASELFYIKKQGRGSFIIFLNFYNLGEVEEDIEVPFKIIVAKENPKSFGKNYMVNPNNILAVAKTKIKRTNPQKVLGLLITTSRESRFYFAEISIGYSIISYNSEYTEKARKSLISFYKDSIELRDVLKRAGAIIVEEKEGADIDLSVENLQKDSILNLLK